MGNDERSVEVTQLFTLLDKSTGRLVGGDRAPVGELASVVSSLAGQLVEAGSLPSAPIAYIAPPGVDGALAFLAAACVGQAAPLNPKLTGEEMRDYIAALKPALVVATADRRADLEVEGVQVTEWVQGPGGLSLKGLPGAAGFAPTPAPDETALILPTSGTTGAPKQVPLTHRQLVASATNIASWLELTNDDVALTMMPLFHIHGLVAGVLAPLLQSGTVAVEPFDAFAFSKVTAQHRPTWMSAVPTMYALLIKRWHDRSDELTIDQLRFARTSSSALAPALLDQIETLLGVPAAEAYGMTEASHQLAANPIAPGARRPGSVGVATGTEIRIENPDDSGRGEVLVRAPQVTHGYRDASTANANAFIDGWFRTGDEGVLDDGWLTLTGRIKEMINRGGEKVAPLEVEEKLHLLNGVVDCAVFAMPHDLLGEEVAAAVVLDRDVDATTVKEHLKGHLAAHKIPNRFEFVDELPVGPTGKVQRSRLAEQLGL